MIYTFGVICFAPSRPEISVHWVPPIEATPTDATTPRGLQTETVIVQPRGPRPDPAAPCPSTEQQCRLTGRDHRDSKCGPRPSSCVSPPPQIAGHGKDERDEQSERFARHPTHRVYSTTQTNVTFQRLYRTEDGKWKSTSSFGRDDLLVLMKVADATHTRVMQLLGEKREQRQEQPAA